MTKKYKNKYRIKSARHPYWDYSGKGIYFITICTKDRRHFFGKIRDGKMILNNIGKLADAEWKKTFELRSDMNLFMGEYIIMPDHFHALISIGNNIHNSAAMPSKNKNIDSNTDAMPRVSDIIDFDPHIIGAKHRASGGGKNKYGPQSKNLASIVRGFKSSVTINARKTIPNFGWQPRYHDHIVRDDRAYINITNYIINNPKNWGKPKHKKS